MLQVNLEPHQTIPRTRNTLRPPPGFELLDKYNEAAELLPPNMPLFSHSSDSNYPSFSNQFQSHQSQSGTWGLKDSWPAPLSNNYQDFPKVPTNGPKNNSYSVYPNIQSINVPIQTNSTNSIYQAREPPTSFLNQNQAQFNLILNSNNLPFTITDFNPVSNNLFLPTSNIARPPLQMPFMPNYSMPINYYQPQVLSQQSYLLQQQLLLQANLAKACNTNFAERTPRFPGHSNCSESTTNQLLNSLQKKAVTHFATKSASSYSEQQAQPGTSSTSCKSIHPQSLPKECSSIISTANPAMSVSEQSRPVTSSTSQYPSKEKYIKVEPETIKEIVKNVDLNKSKLDLSSTSYEAKIIFKKIRRNRVVKTSGFTKDKDIKVELETVEETMKNVDLNRPERALSPTSCEVKNIFKKSHRNKVVKTGNLSRPSSETTMFAERRLSNEDLSSSSPLENQGRMSSLSLLTSTSDEEYASCSENSNQSPCFPTGQVDSHSSHQNVEAAMNPVDEPTIYTTSKNCRRNADKSKTKTSDSSEILVFNVVFKDIDFHIMKVNDRLAVLADEFYPRFTNRPPYFYTKLIEACGKELQVISKTTNPALFHLIEKMEFHSSVDKKSVIKFGTSKISYLSEIPEIFSLLNYENKNLLKRLKDFQNTIKM